MAFIDAVYQDGTTMRLPVDPQRCRFDGTSFHIESRSMKVERKGVIAKMRYVGLVTDTTTEMAEPVKVTKGCYFTALMEVTF